MTYLKLFLVFFKVGLFSFGGGYAILPLMQHEVVDVNKWISFHEFMEIVAVSQITPGPISINLATHVGYRIAQTIGSTIATCCKKNFCSFKNYCCRTYFSSSCCSFC